MRRTLSLLGPLALLLAVAAPPRAQSQSCPTNFANVTVATLGIPTPLKQGILIVYATDASHQPINYSVPGIGIGLTKPFIRAIVNGAITTPLCLPQSNLASVPVGYHFIARDTSPQGGNAIVLDVQDVAITTNPWSLDNYPFSPQTDPYTLTAQVSNVGTPGPQGIQGTTGATGATGPQGPAGATGATGPQGATGASGAAATVAVGTTTTGAPGTAAAVTNSGTSNAATLNFTIPAGPTGAIGPQGPTGATGAQGPQGVPGATGAAGSGSSSLATYTSAGSVKPDGGTISVDASGVIRANGVGTQLSSLQYGLTTLTDSQGISYVADDSPGWPQILWNRYGYASSQLTAIGETQFNCADLNPLGIAALNPTQSTNGPFVISLGENEVNGYGYYGSPFFADYYPSCLMGVAIRAAATPANTVAASALTASSGWTADTTWAHWPGLHTTTNGATLTSSSFVVPNGNFEVHFQRLGGCFSGGTVFESGTFTVSIDGIAQPNTVTGSSTINTNPTQTTAACGLPTHEAVALFSGITPGTHSLSITVTSPTLSTNDVTIYAVTVPPANQTSAVGNPQVYIDGIPWIYQDNTPSQINPESSYGAAVNALNLSYANQLALRGWNVTAIDERAGTNSTLDQLYAASGATPVQGCVPSNSQGHRSGCGQENMAEQVARTLRLLPPSNNPVRLDQILSPTSITTLLMGNNSLNMFPTTPSNGAPVSGVYIGLNDAPQGSSTPPTVFGGMLTGTLNYPGHCVIHLMRFIANVPSGDVMTCDSATGLPSFPAGVELQGGAIFTGSVFGASGSTHSAGIVPDPGATAGATRYLREDGTWSVPAGGNASIPITSYTAPMPLFASTVLATVPASPSAGRNYCVSGTINTTVAGSGAGSMYLAIGFSQPDGTGRAPSIGGGIDLTTVGSTSSAGSGNSGVACFMAKAGSTIYYGTNLSGTVTGYTYQGAWQLQDMGP